MEWKTGMLAMLLGAGLSWPALRETSTQQDEKKYPLKWKLEELKSFTQELSVKGEGVALDATMLFTRAAQPRSEFALKFKNLKVEGAGVLGGFDGFLEEPLGVCVFYGNDEIISPLDTHAALAVGLQRFGRGAKLPFGGGITPPTLGLSLRSSANVEFLLEGYPIGAVWEDRAQENKFRFEKIDAVDGKECALITSKAERKCRGGPEGDLVQREEGRYWFVHEGGYLHKAKVNVSCFKKGENKKPFLTFEIDLSTQVKEN